ncbi:nucleotide exchange factor GrpE [Halobacteriales archaeon QS_1_68_20]|nr:MAG: nucleotide exchange factor GrpE [Halobacteriales archaeon QS_1_68_20]
MSEDGDQATGEVEDSTDAADPEREAEHVDGTEADGSNAEDAGDDAAADGDESAGRGDLVERVADHDEALADDVAALADERDELAARVEDLEADLAEREEEVEDLESRLKRKQADFQNYKKRRKREEQKIRERATEDLVERLLDVRDNLVRALSDDHDDVEGLREGVKMTLGEFDRVLDAEDVQEIDPEPGSEVDPSRHEVMMRVHSDQPEGTVADVYQPGYEMADQVLRAAKVTVSEGGGEEEAAGATDHDAADDDAADGDDAADQGD